MYHTEYSVCVPVSIYHFSNGLCDFFLPSYILLTCTFSYIIDCTTELIYKTHTDNWVKEKAQWNRGKLKEQKKSITTGYPKSFNFGFSLISPTTCHILYNFDGGMFYVLFTLQTHSVPICTCGITYNNIYNEWKL